MKPFLVTAVLLLASCTGGSDTAETTTPSSDTTVPPTATTEPVATTDTSASTTTVTTAPEQSFFGDFDTVITLLTPESGGGIRPALEWEAVPDAATYVVYVYAPSGEPYWSWQGEATSVFVGGAIQIREDAPGPSVTEGMTWMVMAYDAAELPIAASPLRPISP